ncbi:hypothetical protein MKW92_008808, partial [Papaver armeniacum]
MLYHKGKLFVMCLNYAYIEIAIQHGSDIEDAETLSISDVISITYNSSHLEVVGGDLPCQCHLYYVDSFDEVFHIRRLCFPRAPWYMPEWLMISATPRFGDSIRATEHVSEKNECMHKVIGARENQTVDKVGDKEDVKDAGPWMMLKDDHM